MFGLAVIAAVLNLMVLKFMTMNTEDEKRDEIEAIQVSVRTYKTKITIYRVAPNKLYFNLQLKASTILGIS